MNTCCVKRRMQEKFEGLLKKTREGGSNSCSQGEPPNTTTLSFRFFVLFVCLFVLPGAVVGVWEWGVTF